MSEPIPAEQATPPIDLLATCFFRLFQGCAILGLLVGIFLVRAGNLADLLRWSPQALFIWGSGGGLLLSGTPPGRLFFLGLGRHWRAWLPVAAAVAGILGFELALQLISPPEPQADFFRTYYTAGFFQADPRLGYRPAPNRFFRCQKLDSAGNTLFAATYGLDAAGRRVTVQASPGPWRRFALFLGCSVTFGEGVDDPETLPSRFVQHCPEFHGYNLAFLGYGPQHALELLRDPGLRASIAEPEGLLIYPLIHDHVDRAIGTMRVACYWGRNFPCYELDAAGTPVFLGSFATARPWTMFLYDLLFQSAVAWHLHLDLPWSRSARDEDLVAALLAAARDEAGRVFPGSAFHVVISPGQGAWAGPMAATLRQSGLTVHTLSGLDAPNDVFFPDGHPRPALHWRTAVALADSLGLDDPSLIALPQQHPAASGPRPQPPPTWRPRKAGNHDR